MARIKKLMIAEKLWQHELWQKVSKGGLGNCTKYTALNKGNRGRQIEVAGTDQQIINSTTNLTIYSPMWLLIIFSLFPSPWWRIRNRR